MSPDRKLIVLALGGIGIGNIVLIDATSGKSVSTINAMAMAVAFSPDSKTLASCNIDDGSVKLWDPSNGKLIRSFGRNEPCASIAFSQDGQRLATGSGEGVVRLWNSADGTELCALQDDSQSVLSVAFSPDGQSIASGTVDQKVRLWDTTTKKLVHTCPGHNAQEFRGLLRILVHWMSDKGRMKDFLRHHMRCSCNASHPAGLSITVDGTSVPSKYALQIKMRRSLPE